MATAISSGNRAGVHAKLGMSSAASFSATPRSKLGAPSSLRASKTTTFTPAAFRAAARFIVSL